MSDHFAERVCAVSKAELEAKLNVKKVLEEKKLLEEKKVLEERIRHTLTADPIHFEGGQASLTEEGQKNLNKVRSPLAAALGGE